MMKNKMLSIILVVSIVCMAMALPTHAATTFVTTTAGNAAALDGAGAGDVTELPLSVADGGGAINVSTIAVLRDDGGIDGNPQIQWLSMDSDSMGVGNDKWGMDDQRWLFSFDQAIDFDSVEFWGGTQDMQIYSEAWKDDTAVSSSNWNFTSDGTIGTFTFTTNASGPAETFDFTSAGVSSVAAGTQITIVDKSGGGAEMGSFTITPGGGGFDFDPTPADGATVPASAVALTLSWLNLPEPNSVTDSALVDVYWDTDEDGSGGTLVLDESPDALTVDVTADEIGTYYWKIVATDPNTAGDTPYVMGEAVYSLTTTSDNVEPTVEVPDFYTWLEDGSRTVTIDTAVITDDDTSLHLYTWSVATASPTTGATFDPAGPQATYVTDVTFDAAGVYILEVEVDDNDEHIITGTVTVTVHADGCEAAKTETPYTEADARLIGDTNYDCAVNLVDLAAMALNWLADESL